MKYTVEVNLDGDVFWYKEGTKIYHRDNSLPAVEYANGTKSWYVNGQRHRDNDLPAIEYANGDKEWWVNGVQVDEPASCKAKSVMIDGVEYELKSK